MRYSVITINYNNKDGLRKTVESVINQTHNDYEYIIIDGGSTDGSVDVIEEYANRLTYWVSERDGGIYNAMNKGVARAHGDYCIFMNSGDSFYSNDVLSSLSAYNEDIICGKVLKADEVRASGHWRDTITLVDLMRGSLPHQAMIIKRELLVNHPYDENYKIVSDWKFCIESLIFDNCSFLNIDTIIADYDTSGISTNSDGLLPKEKEAIIRELLPQRIVDDYKRFAPVDDDLLDQSILLTQTVKARKLVKWFSNFILCLISKQRNKHD